MPISCGVVSLIRLQCTRPTCILLYTIVLLDLKYIESIDTVSISNYVYTKYQSIKQTSIVPISPAKPGSVARKPNQCSTAKSRETVP